nr:immunoglobulin heavy chain junction region [Macaca mulatta]
CARGYSGYSSNRFDVW